MTLIIHATNVHQGGGKTLLSALLKALDQPSTLLIDERFTTLPEFPSGTTIRKIPPTLLGRLKAEWLLSKQSSSGDIVLCFGNLPPFFVVSGKVYVFLQNRYLTRLRKVHGLGFKTRIRIRIERMWLRLFLRSSKVLVQTETMQYEVKECLGRDARVLPFLPVQEQVNTSSVIKKEFDYLYVATGDPHKNHSRLIKAWVILSDYGLKPSLCLTLDQKQDAEILLWIERLKKKYDLSISNLIYPQDKIQELYNRSKALIFPSLFESFGLPLLEASKAGLPVIAAERDYVRDVADPVTTFDPESALSIARAVMRHLNKNNLLKEPIEATEFLKQLMDQ